MKGCTQMRRESSKMKTKYLKPGDPGSFQDLEIQTNTSLRYALTSITTMQEEIKTLQYRQFSDHTFFTKERALERIKSQFVAIQQYIDTYEEKHVLCPVCQGYGKWNLALNQYPGEGSRRHFKASCSQCSGHGWVRKDSSNESCIHEYVRDRAGEWNCTRYEKCIHCDKEVFIDSGD